MGLSVERGRGRGRGCGRESVDGGDPGRCRGGGRARLAARPVAANGQEVAFTADELLPEAAFPANEVVPEAASTTDEVVTRPSPR